MTCVCLCWQHLELCGDCTVPVWHGCNDHAENTAQRHRSLQPDGRLGKLAVVYLCSCLIHRPDLCDDGFYWTRSRY